MLFYDSMDSPTGPLHLVADECALKQLSWHAPSLAGMQSVRQEENAIISLAKQELTAYFAGKLRQFFVPVAPEGTDFQKQVWSTLAKIPYGETSSYGALAEKLGKPGAARAVGSANHNNPICIVIPCHRVIGKNGSLTGFAGGVEKKAFLLKLEQQNR